MPTTKFIAVGHYEGQTCDLTPSISLVEGVFEFEGSDEEAALLTDMLAGQYNVHREDRYEEARAAFDELKATSALDEPVETPESVERNLRDERMARRFLSEKLSPTTVYGEGPNAKRLQAVMARLVEEEGYEDESPEAAAKAKADEEAAAKAKADEEAAAKAKADADAKAKADAAAKTPAAK